MTSADWLKAIQEALGGVHKALRDLGVQDGDVPYGDVYRALRRADQLVADAMRRIDAGQIVTAEEFDEIAQLFEAIKSAIF